MQWAVRNDAGKTWPYKSAKDAESARAASEMLVVDARDLGVWLHVWGPSPEPCPKALLDEPLPRIRPEGPERHRDGSGC